MVNSGNTTRSACASRAASTPLSTSAALPSRSPTVVFTWASAIRRSRIPLSRTIKKKASSSRNQSCRYGRRTSLSDKQKRRLPLLPYGERRRRRLAHRRAMKGPYSRSRSGLSRLFRGEPFFERPRQEDGLRDLPHGPPGVHALALHDPEGFLLGNLLAPHEEALGPLHQLAHLQSLLHLKGFLHQGRVVDRDRRLAGHRLEHLDLFGRKQVLVRRVAVDHPDRFVLYQHRDRQERAQAFFPGQVWIHVAGVLGHVQHRNRPVLFERLPADALPDFEVRLPPIALAQALRGHDA